MCQARIVPCTESSIEEVAKILLSGGVAIIPTDTVYGLAAHPNFPHAVERLYTIKGRSEQKPIALLCSDISYIQAHNFYFPPKAKEFADSYWPGALTLVLSNAKITEGLRVPNHDWTRSLIAKCGGALRVTSANLSGGQEAIEASQALASIGLEADILVDDGASTGGVASTVIAFPIDGAMRILREGALKL